MSLQAPVQTCTQAALAKIAGVSAVTVHKALSGQKGVSEQKRRQIEDLAAKHGYRLNAAARATREGRTGNVAMVLSTHKSRSHLPPAMVMAIHDELERRQLQLSLTKLPDQRLADAGYVPQILREFVADGLLINYTHAAPPAMLELIQRHAIPSVWLNVRRESDCVYPDDFGAGRLAAESLLDRGHRRIGFVDFASDAGRPEQHHFSSAQRRAGYEAAIRDAGLSPVVHQQDLPGHERLAAARDLLDQPGAPEAWIGYGGYEINALLLAAAGRGADPAAVPCVTFGSHAYDGLGFPVPTVLLPEADMGRTAARMLTEKIDRPRRPLPAAKLPFRLASQ
jgi:DNA-binding LacI/PurR family transcriptional regulator